MCNYVGDLYLTVKRVRSDITLQQIWNLAWAEVGRHELEHCAQELVLATLAILSGRKLKSFDAETLNHKQVTEALATHFEHTDTRYKGGAGDLGCRTYARFVSASKPKPSGYEDWNKLDILKAEEALCHSIGVFYYPEYPMKIRKLLHARAKNNFIQIPQYSV